MDPMSAHHLCPVCGFELDFAPWDGESPSDEICSCCRTQFGYHDSAGRNYEERSKIYAKWRRRWIDQGMPWDKNRSVPPPNWDPIQQLHRIGVEVSKKK